MHLMTSADKYYIKSINSHNVDRIMLFESTGDENDPDEMHGSYDVKKGTFAKRLSEEHKSILQNLMIQEAADHLTEQRKSRSSGRSASSLADVDDELVERITQEVMETAVQTHVNRYNELVDKYNDLVAEVEALDGTYAVIRETACELPGKSLENAKFKEEFVQKGIVGEQRTAGVLSVLMNDSSTRILHSFKRSDMVRDIDHVLFTRKGIFAINTKYRRTPKSAVDEFDKQWSENARDDAREVALSTSKVLSWLSTPLEDEQIQSVYKPMVVLWSESSFEPVELHTANNATLIDGLALVDHISAMPDILPADTVVAMYESLRLSLV